MPRLLACTALTMAAFAVASCSSSGGNAAAPATGGSIRAAAPTAPANLQVVCASEAAAQLELAEDTVLPVSSSQMSDGNYQVNLNAGGGQAVCIIDGTAAVQSIRRV